MKPANLLRLWSVSWTVYLATLVYALPIRALPIAQHAYLKAFNTGTGDQFGCSVAMSGDTVVVGAYGEDSNASGVNGDGNNNSGEQSGGAYVFVRSGGVWIQQAYLKASNTGFYDEFGIAVAISDDTVVVGARGERSNATGVNGNQSNNDASQSGAAYIFVRNGTNWSQQAYLKASNTGIADWFGISVGISGDTVVVGAFRESSDATGVNGDGSNNNAMSSGAAYIFIRTGSTWSQQAYLKASNTGPGDYFGSSVAVSHDTVVIGAPGESSNAVGVDGNGSNDSAEGAGAAYVFVRTGTNWSQQAYLKASNSESNDFFGTSVTVAGNTVLVGASGERSNATGVNGDQTDNSAFYAGGAYVFARNGTNWNQQAYLKASNTEAFDRFGHAVAAADDKVVVTAPGEESSATGVNGNQDDNNAAVSGAAYVFVRSGTNWTQQAYLKASNTGVADLFGYAAAVSGEAILIAAHSESSNATGVNSDQSDNSAPSSGAAYIFSDHVIRLSILTDGGSGFFIRIHGVPDLIYGLQRAPTVAGPWETVDISTAPASGLIEFHDEPPPPGQAFYRTLQP